MHDPVSDVARSVLYEGYILWPYRRSALKNQQRWTFGGVYPAAWSAADHADDAALMRTECLLELDDAAELSVCVRFLHVVERRVACLNGARDVFVDAAVVGGTRHVSWDEAAEREIVAPAVAIRADAAQSSIHIPIRIDGGEHREPLGESEDGRPTVIVRRWQSLRGWLSVETGRVRDGVMRVRVDIANESKWNGEPRAEVLRRTFVSTHTVLRAERGEFVSLIDPPPSLADAAIACRNIGTWPVLAGTAPDRHCVLSSPIILYDYPHVAPESSGDFFDAAEIDQLLVLSVLSMTDAEQAQMRETDPRAREILERCRSLTPEDVLRLHGATRELRPIEERP